MVRLQSSGSYPASTRPKQIHLQIRRKEFVFFTEGVCPLTTFFSACSSSSSTTSPANRFWFLRCSSRLLRSASKRPERRRDAATDRRLSHAKTIMNASETTTSIKLLLKMYRLKDKYCNSVCFYPILLKVQQRAVHRIVSSHRISKLKPNLQLA